MDAVRDALGDVVRFVPSFLLFVVILLLGWLLAVLVRTAVHKLLGRIGFVTSILFADRQSHYLHCFLVP